MDINNYPLLKEILLGAMIGQCAHSDELNVRKTAGLQRLVCQAWRCDDEGGDYSADLLQELDWGELSNDIASALTGKTADMNVGSIIKVAQNELILDRIESNLLGQMDAIYDSYKEDNK